MSRIHLCLMILVLPACSLITKLDPVVPQQGSDGDADSDVDGDADGDIEGDADADADGDGDAADSDTDVEGDFDMDSDSESDSEDDSDVDLDRDTDEGPCGIVFYFEVNTARASTTDVTLTMADLTGDGRPEALTAGADTSSGNATVVYYQNVMEGGRWALSNHVGLLNNPEQVFGAASAGNLDSDPANEVLVFSRFSDREEGSLLIIDNPTTETPNTSEYSGLPPLIGGTLAYIDGDSTLDIVATSIQLVEERQEWHLLVWPQVGDTAAWITSPPSDLSLGGFVPGPILPVNLNAGEDEDDEIIIAVHTPPSSTASLRLIDWSGRLNVVDDAAIPCIPVAMAAANIDSDSQPEILFSCGREGLVNLYRMGTAAAPALGSCEAVDTVLTTVVAFAAADLDDDGDIDLVTHDGVSLHVYCGDGIGGFSELRRFDDLASDRPLVAIDDLDRSGPVPSDVVVFHDVGITMFMEE